MRIDDERIPQVIVQKKIKEDKYRENLDRVGQSQLTWTAARLKDLETEGHKRRKSW